MINCNGVLVSSLLEGDETVIQSLFYELSVNERLRYTKGKILLWETHYFRIIAALRRHRFIIPMDFTMDYLKNEVDKTVEQNATSFEDYLLHFKFIKNEKGVFFILTADGVQSYAPLSSDSYALDLYKEEWIPSGFFSNLSNTNQTLRQIAKTYAYENGLEDCVLLNDQKNLVEATSGTLYLIQGNNILTPNLESGCQDFALRAAFNLWLEKEQEEYRLCEQVINPFELQKSEEIIILSIEKGIQNVSQYRKTTYTKENSGLLFASFMNQLD